MKRLLFLLCLTVAASRGEAQSNLSCPLHLESADLDPAHRHIFVLPNDFSRNLERVLRVRYKNVSGKEIASGHISASISLYEPGPVQAKTVYGELDLDLPSSVRTQEEKTAKQKVLTSGVPPRVWVREVTFSDGSRWTSSDPAQCQYSPRAVRVARGPIIPPL